MLTLRKAFFGFFFSVMILSLIYSLSREFMEDAKTAEAVQEMAAYLDSGKHFNVRLAAVEAMAETEHRTVVNVISEKWKSEDCPKIVAGMVSALGSTQQPGAIELIKEICKTWHGKEVSSEYADNPALYGTPVDIESAAIEALVLINTGESFRALIEIASDAGEKYNKEVKDAFANLNADTQKGIMDKLKSEYPLFAEDDNSWLIGVINEPEFVDNISATNPHAGFTGYFKGLIGAYNALSGTLKTMKCSELNALLEEAEKSSGKELFASLLPQLRERSIAEIDYEECKENKNNHKTLNQLIYALLDLSTTEFWGRAEQCTPMARFIATAGQHVGYIGMLDEKKKIKSGLIGAIADLNRGQLEKLYSMALEINPGLTIQSEPNLIAAAFFVMSDSRREEYIAWLKKDMLLPESAVIQDFINSYLNAATDGDKEKVLNDLSDKLSAGKIDAKIGNDLFNVIKSSLPEKDSGKAEQFLKGDIKESIAKMAELPAYTLKAIVSRLQVIANKNAFDIISQINTKSTQMKKEITAAVKALPEDAYKELLIAVDRGVANDNNIYSNRIVIDSRLSRDDFADVWMQGAANFGVINAVSGQFAFIAALKRGVGGFNGALQTVMNIVKNDDYRKMVSAALGNAVLYDKKEDNAAWIDAVKNSDITALCNEMNKKYPEINRFYNALSAMQAILSPLLADREKNTYFSYYNISERIEPTLMDIVNNDKSALARLIALKMLVYVIGDNERIGTFLKGIVEKDLKNAIENNQFPGLAQYKYVGRMDVMRDIFAILLKGDDKYRIYNAANVAEKMPEIEAVELFESLKDAAERYKDEHFVLAPLAKALAKLKNPEAHQLFIDMIDEKQSKEINKIALQYIAQQEKGSIVAKSLTDIISAISKKENSLLDDCIDALGVIDDEKVVSVLHEIFEYETADEAIKAKVVKSWGNTGSKAAYKYILQARFSGYPIIRENAAAAFGNIQDEESITALLNIINTPHETVKTVSNTMASLLMLKNKTNSDSAVDSFKPITDMMKKDPVTDEEARASVMAIEAFGLNKVGEDIDKDKKNQNIEKYIFPLFGSKNIEIRRAAADALLAFSERETIDAMAQSLNNKEETDDVTIAKLSICIGVMKEPRIRRLVLEKIDDIDPAKSPLAYRNLSTLVGALKGRANIGNFIKFIKDESLQANVRIACLSAWKEIDNSQGLEDIMALAVNEKDDRVRLKAVDALEKYSSAKVIECLTGILNNMDERPAIRAKAAFILTYSEDKRPFDALNKAVAEQETEVKRAIADAVQKKNQSNYFPFYDIVKTLESEDSNTIMQLCSAMMLIDYSPHRDELAKLFKHPNPGVRNFAKMAIRKICASRTGDYAKYLVEKIKAVEEMQKQIEAGKINKDWTPIRKVKE